MLEKEFLQEIGINLSGYYDKSNKYVVDLSDSDEYGRIFSKLNKSDLVEENDSASQITVNNSTIVYEGEEYDIILQADFDNDLYKIIVT